MNSMKAFSVELSESVAAVHRAMDSFVDCLERGLPIPDRQSELDKDYQKELDAWIRHYCVSFRPNVSIQPGQQGAAESGEALAPVERMADCSETMTARGTPLSHKDGEILSQIRGYIAAIEGLGRDWFTMAELVDRLPCIDKKHMTRRGEVHLSWLLREDCWISEYREVADPLKRAEPARKRRVYVANNPEFLSDV